MQQKPHPYRFWNAALSLLASLAALAVLAAIGVSLLFVYTQYGRPRRGGIPNSGILLPGTQASTPTVTATQSPTSGFASSTPTPFQPVPNTATPTQTPTQTPTSTPTATATSTSTRTPRPTRTPVPPTATPEDWLPGEAYVSGIAGYAQALPLSCESRSAVDWARYFGVDIRELDFQYALPFTDNPNTGFVGDPRDPRGMVPPSSYGVHAAPVASLLRSYGLSAESYSGYDWNDVRRELAAGRPVIAWVIGNVWTGYSGRSYTASDGETVTVAPYEHTVIVIGYTPGYVTVVDNDLVYSATTERFLASWSVLGNMVIIMNTSSQ